MGIARAGEAGLGALDTRPLSAWEPAPRRPSRRWWGVPRAGAEGSGYRALYQGQSRAGLRLVSASRRVALVSARHQVCRGLEASGRTGEASSWAGEMVSEPRHLPGASLGGLEPRRHERESCSVCVSARACDCEKVRKEGAKGGELRTSGGKGVGEQGKGEECVRGEEEGQSWGEG